MILDIRAILESSLTGISLPIIFDNLNNSGSTEFVRCTLENADSVATDIGRSKRVERLVGIFSCQVFTNSSIGHGKNSTVCEEIATKFRNKTFMKNNTVVEIIAVNFRTIGTESATGLYHQNVIVEFRATHEYNV